MAEEILDPRQEVKTILDHLRFHLQEWKESGLDVPRLTPQTLAALAANPVQAETLSLAALQKSMEHCRHCNLHRGRTRLVFGEGSPNAQLVFVGEGPGQEEDLQGRPFVGEAGRLLTKIIEAMGLNRNRVYIANVVKCRPPHNRDPQADEIEACLPFLKKQLAGIRPRVICTLGRIAGQALLGADFQLSRQRGIWSAYNDIPLMPTFHPAYLLRNPSAKRQVWEDVQKIMKHLGLEVMKKNV